MKVALCLSGQPRCLKQGFQFHKKCLLDRYDIDVFIHSWNSEFNDDIVNLYNPKEVIIENYKFTKDHEIKYLNQHNEKEDYPWRPRFALNSFYSIYQANQLRHENEIKEFIEYDWVIRSRFDYAFNRKIEFENLDNKYLYIPERVCPEWPNEMICDQFAFSNSHMMNLYSNTFLHIDEYHSKGTYLIGEHLFSRNLNKYKLIDFIMYYDLDREFKDRDPSQQGLLRTDIEYWKKHDNVIYSPTESFYDRFESIELGPPVSNES